MTSIHKQTRWRVFLFLIVLTALLSGCATGMDRGKDFERSAQVTVSQDAAVQLANKFVRATQGAAQTGLFRLTVTETEVTSALALGAQLNSVMQMAGSLTPEQAQQVQDLDDLLAISDDPLADGFQLTDLKPRLTLRQPQVRFLSNGQVELTGYFNVWRWFLPLSIFFAPRAAQGEMTLDFVEGAIGPIPLHEGAVDWLGDQIVTGLGLVEDYVAIETISVQAGKMTLAGQARVK